MSIGFEMKYRSPYIDTVNTPVYYASSLVGKWWLFFKRRVQWEVHFSADNLESWFPTLRLARLLHFFEIVCDSSFENVQLGS
jgi:hypothetical protein